MVLAGRPQVVGQTGGIQVPAVLQAAGAVAEAPELSEGTPATTTV